jgi:hypothetical protein
LSDICGLVLPFLKNRNKKQKQYATEPKEISMQSNYRRQVKKKPRQSLRYMHYVQKPSPALPSLSQLIL